jgi:hypothetical protein
MNQNLFHYLINANIFKDNIKFEMFTLNGKNFNRHVSTASEKTKAKQLEKYKTWKIITPKDYAQFLQVRRQFKFN